MVLQAWMARPAQRLRVVAFCELNVIPRRSPPRVEKRHNRYLEPGLGHDTARFKEVARITFIIELEDVCGLTGGQRFGSVQILPRPIT